MDLVYQHNYTHKLYKIFKEEIDKVILIEQELLYVNNTTNEHFCLQTNKFEFITKEDFSKNFNEIKIRKSPTSLFNDEMSSKIKF